MGAYIFAEENGRTIPLEDKIFGISRLAKERIKTDGRDAVIDGTIGSLLDDSGKLAILSSVMEVLRDLAPEEYADYAPIGGTPDFRVAVKKAAFGSYEPKCFTEAVATPGGTGALRNTIANFSKPGDKILTTDWFWAPYGTIAGEQGRGLVTFTLFDEKGGFNIESFKTKVNELMEAQGRLVIFMNTPAHNPTGYSLSLADWDGVVEVMKAAATGERKITLLVDAAYIDFAGDEEEYRKFLPKLDGLPENILPIIAYSLSKTFTLYGMRCGAMICMTPSNEIAQEFKRVSEYSARGSWSNSTRAAQTVLAKIYADPALLKKVDEERAGYRDMLLARGRAFEAAAKEVGLEILPFDAGFFASIPCSNPEKAGELLQKEGIFIVPLAKGLRVSIASVSEEKCKKIPAAVKAVLEK